MNHRRVLLAVSAGIAAYKAPELVRALRGVGLGVRCVLTPEAERFVSSLVLQTLSGEGVRSALFDSEEEGRIDRYGPRLNDNHNNKRADG